MRTLIVAAALALVALDAPAEPADARAVARDVLAVACAEPLDAGRLAGALPGLLDHASEPLEARGQRLGARHRLTLPGGYEARLERIAPVGILRRVTVEIHAPGADGARPALMVVAGPGCQVLSARRLVYGAHGAAEAIESLEPDLERVRAREALDAPVPAGRSTPGVPVALVDAGVNYLLPEIATRLVRDADGTARGYDYWSMDPRPFDANPARSPFHPQRHGTRTAALLLDESPVARLVPYRYPRPHMDRMTALVADAAASGARIVNLSLGSADGEAWQAFEGAARAHPGMLFVVSAGNDGRDVDEHPVYPASSRLDNQITVTSVEADGRLARGSNWGARSVHLGVEGERQVTTDFYGQPREVSGSSYAAARVSALAACLLAAHPGWDAARLRAAILARAAPGPEPDVLAAGVLLDRSTGDRGACPRFPARAAVVETLAWSTPRPAASPGEPLLAVRPRLVVLEHSGWTLGAVHAAIARAAAILGRCAVTTPEIAVERVDAPRRYRFFRDDLSAALIGEHPVARPAVFFVRGTLAEERYEAVAVGRGNSMGRRALENTVWITAGARDPGIVLAHEIYHVLTDSGDHENDPANLMHETTSGANDALREDQCRRLRNVGAALGMLAAG